MVDSSLRDGGTAHRQLPMNANIGLSYRVRGVQLSWSFNYYANHLAQWNGKERSFRDGFEAGMGIDYTFSDVPLNIGCGYMFTTAGTRPSGQSQIAEMPDGHTMGAGLTYTFDKRVKLTFAFGFIYWMPVDVNRGTPLRLLPAYFHKTGYDIALGAECKVI
jgi:long-subunit fatty acid transport protein